MENGFYKISDDEYHHNSWAKFISRSGLHRLLRSPAHFKTPVEETHTLNFGKWFHLGVLEPERFKEETIIKPEDMKFSTKEGKAWRAEADATGKEIISHKDWQLILNMEQAIRRNKTARDLLSDGEAEISGYWTDPSYPEIGCKMRMDWVNKAKRVIVDLKKTTDARQHQFTSLAYRLGYHLEAAWYLYGATQITRIEHHDFYFICVEAEAPYGVMVYKADQDMIQKGLVECSKAIDIYRECMEKNEWPCYPDEVKDLSLPGWVMRTQDNVLYEGGGF